MVLLYYNLLNVNDYRISVWLHDVHKISKQTTATGACPQSRIKRQYTRLSRGTNAVAACDRTADDVDKRGRIENGAKYVSST